MIFLNIVHSGLQCYCVLSKMLYLSNKSGKLPLFSLSLSQNCHARLVSFCAKGEGRVLFSFLALIKVVYSQFIHSYCLFPLQTSFFESQKRLSKIVMQGWSHFIQRECSLLFSGTQKIVLYSSLRGCPIIIWTGLNLKIGTVQNSYQ